MPRHTAQVQRAERGSEQVSNLLTGPQFESQRLNPCGLILSQRKKSGKKDALGEVAGRLRPGRTSGKFHCLGGSIPSVTKQEMPAPLRIHQLQMHGEGATCGRSTWAGRTSPGWAAFSARSRCGPPVFTEQPRVLPLAHTDPGRRLWKQVSRVPSRRAPGQLYSLGVLCLKNGAVGPSLGHCRG